MAAEIDVRVDVDTGRLEEVESRLERIDSSEVESDVTVTDGGDTSELEARLERLENQVREAEVDVNADGLSRTEASIDRISRDRTANVYVNRVGDGGGGDVSTEPFRAKLGVPDDSDIDLSDVTRNAEQMADHFGASADAIENIEETDGGYYVDMDLPQRTTDLMQERDQLDGRSDNYDIRAQARLASRNFAKELDKYDISLTPEERTEIFSTPDTISETAAGRMDKVRDRVDDEIHITNQGDMVFRDDNGNLNIRSRDEERGLITDYDLDRKTRHTFDVNDNDRIEGHERVDYSDLEEREQRMIDRVRDPARRLEANPRTGKSEAHLQDPTLQDPANIGGGDISDRDNPLGRREQARRWVRQREFSALQFADRVSEQVSDKTEKRFKGVAGLDKDQSFQALGRDDDTRVGNKVRRSINRVKKATRSAIPSMSTWYRLLGAAIPLMITFGTHALGVAAAMGAVGVAGAGLFAGLLGHGEDLNSSLDEAQTRAKELGTEMFDVFQPGLQLLAPAQERLFDRMPNYAEPMAESVGDLTEYEDTIHGVFRGAFEFGGEFLDLLVDMEDTTSQLTQRFGPILGDNILGGIRWFIEEADEHQEMIIQLGGAIQSFLIILYELSMVASRVLVMFTPFIDLIAWVVSSNLFQTFGSGLVFLAVALWGLSSAFSVATVAGSGLVTVLGLVGGAATVAQMSMMPLLVTVLAITSAVLLLWELLGDAPMIPDFGAGSDGPGNDLWGGDDGPSGPSGPSGGGGGGLPSGMSPVESTSGDGDTYQQITVEGDVNGTQGKWALEEGARRISRQEDEITTKRTNEMDTP